MENFSGGRRNKRGHGPSNRRMRHDSFGRRGGGRGRGYDDDDRRRERDESDDRSSSDRPPPGLRGRALGLWHRDRQKKKKADGSEGYAVKKEKPVLLNIESSLIEKIKEFLESVEPKPPEHIVKKYELITSCRDSKGNEKPDPDKANSSEGYAPTTEKYDHLEESRFKKHFIKSITGNIEANINKSITSNVRKMDRIPQLDGELKNDLKMKESNSSYQRMLSFRKKLPSYKMKSEILELVEKNQVVVISGETGCGKTTQVAQFLLDNEIEKGNGSKCHIICTQPRRISAISVAERVADERAEKVGNKSVGYQIRVEKVLPRSRGSILFCTTGILLKHMVSDPALSEVSHVIIDEIHERDTVSDFAITILKSILKKRRDLKLILMSATLNAERFSSYYNNCPKLEIPGFTFPVKEYFLEDVLQMTRFSLDENNRKGPGNGFRGRKLNAKKQEEYDDFILPHIRHLESSRKYDRRVLDTLRNPDIEEVNLDLIKALVIHICKEVRKDGAILIFLPGLDKITALHKMLTESGQFTSGRFLIIPLHSLLPTSQQKAVFERPPSGVRKIVIATNIAETSITIDDVVYVIDCGKIKMKNFDLKNNITTLNAEWVSLANAHQRRGRAGRVQEGICYHLYSRAREMTFDNYPLPEMLRTRLEEVILQAKILQVGQIKPFLQKVLDPPNPAAIDLSLKMLLDMNAIDSDESLTPLGHHLAQLPVDPQIGKMILMAALFGCVDPIFSVAASLGFKDAFVVPMNKEKEVNDIRDNFDMGRKSDHLLMAEAFSQWEKAEYEGWGYQFCNESFLIRNTLYLLRDMKKQFADYLYDMRFLSSKDHKELNSNQNSQNVGLLRAIICAGLYPNVAVIRNVKMVNGKNGKRCMAIMHTVEDGKVELHPRSVNDRSVSFESKFLLYHLKLKTTKIYLHDTTMVHPLPLFFFGHSVNMCEEKGKTVFELSHKVRFAIDPDAARVILDLRIRLDWILEKKISNPGTIDWNSDSEEVLILSAITQLISNEDSFLMDEDFIGSDSED